MLKRACEFLRVLSVSVALTSCFWSDPDCPALELGEQLSFVLGEPFDGVAADVWAPNGCELEYGLKPGLELIGTVEDFSFGNTCSAAMGALDGLSNVELAWDEEQLQRGDSIFRVSYSYKNKNTGCSGSLSVKADGGELPTPDWNGQGEPPAFIWFNFSPSQKDSSTCSDECRVRYSLQASKVE